MYKDLQDKITYMAIGIRFGRHFSINDNIGHMVDNILYSNNSFFNPDFFPIISADFNQRVLVNEENKNRLTINESNVVLEYNITNPDDLKDIDKCYEAFNKFVVVGILKNFDISKIIRTGHMLRYSIEDKDITNKFMTSTIGDTISDINEINLRFSKKYPVEKALIQKDTDDYCNVIYTINKKSGSDELLVSVDYQMFYKPFLNDPEDIKFNRFIELSKVYNKTKFIKWLNKFKEK